MPSDESEEAGGPDPLCFVLMPFGRKSDATGSTIDFDAVYRELIEPAIRAAELDPVRADEEVVGGIIHKAMFERLILCDYAIADLTFANANVFYELGVRHAVRPHTTVLVFAAGTHLPFDVNLDRGLPYTVSPGGTPAKLEQERKSLRDRLVSAREAAVDSPIFQLVEGFPAQVDRLKTDIFRDRVRYSSTWKNRLAAARGAGLAAVRSAEDELGDIRDVEAGILVDLYLSYRAVKGYEAMVSLAERMPRPLAKTAMIREQLGFALNRMGRGPEAERVLRDLIAERGPSSETFAILGRVYKDRWKEALGRDETFLAAGLLDQAIEAYLDGFEADWRDPYPGINVLTLMEVRDPPDARRERLLPVVSYAAERRLGTPEADYWDQATVLELAVLAKDEDGARTALGRALAFAREPWEPESTADNLKLIRESRRRRGDEVAWAAETEEALRRRGESIATSPARRSR